MDPFYLWAAAGAVMGAAAGMIFITLLRSSRDAEDDAERCRLAGQCRRAEGRARLEREAKDLKQAECDELDRQLHAAELKAAAARQSADEARAEAKELRLALHAAAEAACGAEKRAAAAQKKLKAMEAAKDREIEKWRRRHKDVKKTMRRKRKIRDVIARGKKRGNRRPFPNPGNGSSRSKFHHAAFTMEELSGCQVVKQPPCTHTKQ